MAADLVRGRCIAKFATWQKYDLVKPFNGPDDFSGFCESGQVGFEEKKKAFPHKD